MKTFSIRPGFENKKEIPCPICGSSHFRPKWAAEDYHFVLCNSCGLIYQNPQPLSEELRKRYDQEYFDYEHDNELQFFHLMELGLQDIAFTQATAAYQGAQKSFLDIGCATGMLISKLNHQGWRTQGVEICSPSAEYGRSKRSVEIFTGTLDEAAFPEGSFSVVHCSHLIEHLTDPVSFVEEVSRVLARDGLFIVTTPNADGFQARLFRGKWRSAIADHVILYSRSTLIHLLQENGFRVIRKKTWGGLAAGTAPRFIKAVADRLAKPLSFGDVMIVLAGRV